MKILIIRPGALGDTLMLTPALAGMKGLEDIHLVARRPGLDVLRPFVKTGMDYERGGWHRLFMDDPLLIPTKPPLSTGGGVGEAERLDLAVAFLSDRSGAVREKLKVLVPAPSIHVFPPLPQKNESVHAALYLAESLAATGCPITPARVIEDAVKRPLLWGEAFPYPNDRRIVFHPGSGGASKNHPPEFWTALLRDFRDTVAGKASLAVLLGPAEEACLSFYREQLSGDETEILFSPEMGPLLRLLKSARLFLGQDSGITHLAAMLGTPTIALFRNSNLKQWKPLGPTVEVIEGENRPGLREEVCERAQEMVL